MSITTLLFDLDGTLLPLDTTLFTKAYFGALAKKLAPHGYDPEALIQSVWAGIKEMYKNDGTRTNEEVFWSLFTSLHGEKALDDKPIFDEFYRVEFQGVQAACGFDPAAANTVAYAKSRGLRVAVATNPLFPDEAIRSRLRWAGIDPDDLELYTTYEHFHHCKPNPAYYREVMERLGVSPEECLMVGNDVDEDMVAEALGAKVFLMPACLLNKQDKDISRYPQGDFKDLQNYIDTLCR